MRNRTGPQNLELKNLISELNKHKSNKLWKRISKELSMPTRKRVSVNLEKINKYTRDNEIALVPGKVLGNGEINKKIKIAAYIYSTSAKEKLKDKAILIKDLIKENTKGKKFRIIK